MLHYKNYELKTTLMLPCTVKEIWFPETEEELKELLYFYLDIPVIADGTNIVCKPVIERLICLRKMPNNLTGDFCKNFVIISCDANVKFYKLMRFTLDNNLGGFELLYGLPGTIGAAIYGNSGSGKGTISDNLAHVACIDREGNYKLYDKNRLNFSRRYSKLQDTGEVIVRANFIIEKKEIDLECLKEVKEHRMRIPHRSAGGFFKNWHSLKPYSEELIGLRVGGAYVSEMVNVIVNDGTATFDDVMTLVDKIRKIVGEPLELEVRII